MTINDHEFDFREYTIYKDFFVLPYPEAFLFLRFEGGGDEAFKSKSYFKFKCNETRGIYRTSPFGLRSRPFFPVPL